MTENVRRTLEMIDMLSALKLTLQLCYSMRLGDSTWPPVERSNEARQSLTSTAGANVLCSTFEPLISAGAAPKRSSLVRRSSLLV